MSEQKRKQIPIGYWLKRADELLTKRIDDVQRANGLTRLSWQALNVIRERGAVRQNEIVDKLRPFAEAVAVHDILAELVERGVVSGSAGKELELTSAGIDLYDRALLAQQEIRQRAVAGISEAEYAATVSVIQRLVDNLERDDTA